LSIENPFASYVKFFAGVVAKHVAIARIVQRAAAVEGRSSAIPKRAFSWINP
jgi:hypothetical protein